MTDGRSQATNNKENFLKIDSLCSPSSVICLLNSGYLLVDKQRLRPVVDHFLVDDAFADARL